MWPTPRAMDGAKGSLRLTPGAINHVESGRGNLAEYVQMWPTPQARDSHNRSGQADRYLIEKRYNLQDKMAADGIHGSLNPTWVEWLLGLPIGWTDLGG